MRMSEAAKIMEDFRLTSKIQAAIFSTLSMVTQIHIWHWQTRSYAEHETLGKYYELLQEKVDELAEVYLGAGGKMGKMRHDPIKDYSREAAKDSIKQYKEELAYTQRALMDGDDPMYDAVADTMLDLVRESDRVLYQLELD